MSRNQIFTEAGEAGIPQQTREQAQQELGFDIPVEQVPLPSLGKVYPKDHPLHMKESVQIRAMTAREEDILTSRALIKTGEVVSALIKSCMIDKSVNPSELLAGDRNAILTGIRVTGYGADYNVDVTCPVCNTRQKCACNLTDLPLRMLELDPVEMGVNAFSLTLPVSGKRATVRFVTGADEEEAIVINERKKKHGMQVDNLVTDRLFRSIVSIDGNNDRSKIRQFINNMPARDSLTIRKFLDQNEPGIEQNLAFECDMCGHEEEMPLPMGANFFWPDS